MEWIKYIRITLGLSQDQMANYLLITRTMFAYYETGRRSPPVVVIQKLIALQELIKDYDCSPMAGIKIPEYLEMDEKQLNTLQNRQQVCKIQAERLQQKLNDLKTAYRECLRSSDMLALLPNRLKEADDKKRVELWLSICTDEIRTRMKSCGLPQQHALRLRVAALKAEAAEIRKILMEIRC